MAERDRTHIVVPFDPTTERYSPYSSPRGGAAPPSPADPRTYGEGLLAQLAASTATGNQRRQDAVRVTGAIDGLYMTFEGQPNVDLALESLEPQQGRQPPELKSVKMVETEEGAVQQAVVFVPDSAVPKYVKRLEQYATETTRTGRPRHSNLVERIRAVRLASLEELWTEPDEAFPPASEDVWWEIWLRRRDDREINRFHIYADRVGIEVGDRELVFDDRVVLLAFGSAERLASSLDALDDLAELRKPRPLATFLPDLPPAQQADWADDLLSRTVLADERSPAVTILDSGVQRAHPLLEHALYEADCHTCEPAWGTADQDGHGTQMAGLALYGSVDAAVTSGDVIELSCRLESVKVLPPTGANDPSLYGAIVASAVGRVEIAAPRRRRAFVMAVSSPGAEESSNLGQPTSWSATIDALSVGRSVVEQPGGLVYLSEPDDQEQRLFILSAGNVEHPWVEGHLDRSDVSPVEDPGFSWNALTVGAFTDKIDVGNEPQYAGWQALAPAGELSPASRTSVTFERRWPLKPEIVCEGGTPREMRPGQRCLLRRRCKF